MTLGHPNRLKDFFVHSRKIATRSQTFPSELRTNLKTNSLPQVSIPSTLIGQMMVKELLLIDSMTFFRWRMMLGASSSTNYVLDVAFESSVDVNFFM